jgi:hypothetical protein
VANPDRRQLVALAFPAFAVALQIPVLDLDAGDERGCSAISSNIARRVGSARNGGRLASSNRGRVSSTGTTVSGVGNGLRLGTTNIQRDRTKL